MLPISAKLAPLLLEKAAFFGRYKHGCIFHTRAIWTLMMSLFLRIKAVTRASFLGSC
jgi:hypothetical protein